MKKQIGNDIFKTAYDELNPEGLTNTSVLDKSAFNINMASGPLIGALTGALVASRKAKQDIFKHQMEQNNNQNINGNYYSQVSNIASGLKVVFTPFGISYLVKSNNRDTNIENIETEEMNEEMYGAWQRKDENYFKNLLLNKMHSDIQLVEQHFAKNFIENQEHMTNQINKQASDEDFDNISDFELIEKIANIKNLYSKQSSLTEKIAEMLYDIMDDNSTYSISLGLDKPISKYAGLGIPLEFLGFGDNSSDYKKYSNPSFLISKIKVGFMPDRVIYSVDNKVITTLLAMHMDENSFCHFEKQDKNYFEGLFKYEAQKGYQRSNGQIPPNINFEKKASYEGISQIFNRADIHPVIYFLLLTRKYSATWMAWDCEALIKILETDFNLINGISDIPLNKILSIQLANNSDSVYTQHHAFEKIIRAFNNKSIDFFENEVNDMTMEDLAFGISILEQVTPHQDIFMNFTQNVFEHMVEILLADENKVFIPISLTDTDYEK